MPDQNDIADLRRRLAQAEHRLDAGAGQEEALRNMEVRRRLLIGNWAQAIWETEADGAIVDDSPSWRAYTGQTLDEWLGHGWLNAVHPEDRPYADRQWWDAIATCGLVDTEFRLHAPDGGWRWTNVRAAPVLDPQGAAEKWVGINIDIDARKRTEAALRESEELRRIAIQGGGMGTWRWNLQSGLIWGDAAFLDLWGYPPSDEARLLSDFTERMSLQGQAEIGELVSRAIARGEEFDGQLAVVGGPTVGRWVRWRGRAERDRPEIVNGVSFDVTAQRQAEEQLRESEAELRHTIELNPQITWTASPDGRMNMSSERWTDWTGGHGLGEEWHEVQHPDDFPAMYEKWMHGVHTGEPVDVEHRTRIARDGSYRWMRSRAYPRRNAQGEIVKWYGTTEDIHERKLAVEALRESEARFRQFAQASSSGLWIRDAGTLAMEFVSPANSAIYGTKPNGLIGDVSRWEAVIVPEDREVARRHIEQARQGETVVHEFRIRRPSDQAVRWIRNTDFPLYAGEHIQRIGGIAEDITERREWEERQKVLVAELQHRTRNLMGVVRSIADKTARASADLPDFRLRFRTRLEALSRVQSLLSRLADHDRVTFDELIRTELAVMDGIADRVTLDGPDGIRLRSSTVQTLAMALHELTTNAMKYGALGQAAGRLTILWSIDAGGEGDEPWLHIDWRETGVAMPLPGASPQGTGQGRELIEKALPYQLGAKTTYALGPDGVHCTISIPVSATSSETEDQD